MSDPAFVSDDGRLVGRIYDNRRAEGARYLCQCIDRKLFLYGNLR